MVSLKQADVYLEVLLKQEGVPFTEQENGTAQVFIISRNGQLVLRTTSELPKEMSSRRVMVKYLVPDKSDTFRNTGLVDINTTCLVPRFANIGKTDKGQPFIYQGEDGCSGQLIVLPFDLKSILKHRSIKLKQFVSKGARLPYETVALTDRGGVRRVFAGCLRLLLNSQNIPYVHLSYVPMGYRSIFGFRVDTDFSSPAEISAAAKIAQDLGMKWTWFLSTAPITAGLSDLVKMLSGHDIQFHCHRHLVYQDFEHNLDNFSKGINILKDAGVKPIGVAAPYGEWNENLNSVFVKLGFEYSSEFGYSYDDVPSRPIVNKKESSVLQIPVHPVSLGRLVWARMDEESMIAYYRRVIDLQIVRQEPCFLYDHPHMIVRYPRVISEVIKYGLECCGAWMTMSDFCRWWQKREMVKYDCRFIEGGIEVTSANGMDDIGLVLEYGQKRAGLPLCAQRCDFDAVKWEPVTVMPFDSSELRIKKYPLTLHAHEIVRQIQKRLQIRRQTV